MSMYGIYIHLQCHLQIQTQTLPGLFSWVLAIYQNQIVVIIIWGTISKRTYSIRAPGLGSHTKILSGSLR